jgi:hypothetical protein
MGNGYSATDNAKIAVRRTAQKEEREHVTIRATQRYVPPHLRQRSPAPPPAEETDLGGE